MTTESQALATQPDPPNAFAAANRAEFELAQRRAKAFSASTLVPQQYQGNLANVLIATELAERIGCSVFAIMQNVDIIHGNPSMRSKFLIATVNACGRFTPLRFRWEGDQNSPDYGCRAVSTDRESGEECIGALISWRMVRAEGWDKKKGSKWITMPEQMFMYRSAAFWQRIYAPELSLGMHTREESDDMTVVVGTARSSGLGRKFDALHEPAQPEGNAPAEDIDDPIDADASADPAARAKASSLGEKMTPHDPVTGEVLDGK